jgi:hypothetical protein
MQQHSGWNPEHQVHLQSEILRDLERPVPKKKLRTVDLNRQPPAEIRRWVQKYMASAGGHARAVALSPARICSIARKAANARWHPEKP